MSKTTRLPFYVLQSEEYGGLHFLPFIVLYQFTALWMSATQQHLD